MNERVGLLIGGYLDGQDVYKRWGTGAEGFLLSHPQG